ncbi:transposase [Solwaraspora sp. WMMD1047]|uniref:transposase n=1 Tax=Solwaraspora sp. WMMD1047 TaxID=3016102 RepID=UPI0024174451|nr:transposase [Solwaraspora sp. WMMD1047]MDG4833363.1 transposase [Solwaraspora sp. WMMD1047]
MSREEDDAVALVRVYCGLASADSAGRPVSAGSTLTAAVVDDAGRLLHVCEIGDDPAGYAQLGSLLVERSSGPSGAAIAADSDDHVVTSLLSAAGRPLAIVDDDLVDDFAERFADDESVEEMESPPAQRRAVGLARALQAGALSATTLPAPRDLAGFKPVLAAHAALANGRHGAAVALREVLRELYPAALRAYPDPAEPVSLAVLDALPEPGLLGGTSARGRDTSVATDAIAAHLAADGVADAAAITDAVTALRVAIAETPRRAPANQALTSAVAETVRQAVAAVRACDAACDALVATLDARVTTPAPVSGRRTVRRAAPEAPAALAPARSGSDRRAAYDDRGAPEPAVLAGRVATENRPNGRPAHEPVPSGGRRSRPEPATSLPLPPRPVAPPPVAPAPVAPPPVAPRPVAPAAAHAAPVSAAPAPTSAPPGPGRRSDPPANRPISAPPPPPPGITPISPAARGPVPPADAGEPFRATLTTAAINSARSERRPTPITPRPKTNGESRPPTGGFGATDLTLPMPAPRPDNAPAPGSRANWPLVNSGDRPDAPAAQDRPFTFGDPPAELQRRTGAAAEGRVTPPWLADDLPPEPPTLRLVEPPTEERLGEERSRRGERVLDGDRRHAADRAGRDALDGDRSRRDPLDGGRSRRDALDGGRLPERSPVGGLAQREEPRFDAPPLRLVDQESTDRGGRSGRSRRAAEIGDPPSAPVSSEGDGDLLIFAATRSAWFTGHAEESELDWSSTAADTGWRAAEQAAQPAVGAETEAGLPKRVPQANLVPGSPLRDERPLRIVRDAARIAEHTTGYFRGWRRGQEIGGYAVGGRPGREAAGGWDFSRDPIERDDRDFEFRPASYRS